MFKFPVKICFLVFASLLFWNTIQAQNTFKDIANRIDSLADLGLPKSALQEVEKMEILARKNNQPAEIIRATIYRITFISYTEEKGFNLIIDRLNNDIQTANFPTKPVLQSLLAEMYWKYYQQNRWRFHNRSHISVVNADIDTWNLQTIINQTSLLYHASLEEAKKEQNTPIDILSNVLVGDQSNRYLRPSMYDLLVHRALDFFLADEPALTRPQIPFSLNNPDFFEPAEKFVQLKISDTDTASTFYQGMKYLQQASLFHLENKNDEALAELDIKRFEFLYSKSNFSKALLYVNALDKIAKQYTSNPISADALTLIGKYYWGKDSLLTALTYLEKAAHNHPKSVGGQNAENLIQVIKAKNLVVNVEDVYTPNKPLLARIEFKNVQDVNVQLYKLNEDQLEAYYNALRQTFSINYDQKRVLKNKATAFLKSFKTIRDFRLTLPKTDDFRKHSIEFKLSTLEPGNYVMLINDVAQDDSSMLQFTDFKVSQLAYVKRNNPDQSTEIRIMDRESGKPLKGVSLSFSRKDKKGKNSVYERGISMAGGLYKSTTTLDDKTTIQFSFQKDTLVKTANINRNFSEEDKAEQRTIFFTDRQIYRPGQTLYFKGMQLETYQNKSKILTGARIQVDFEDENGEIIKEEKFVTNEFGTFNGSIIIPQNILQGNLTLATDDGEISVRVEEYKRPTFTINFDTLKTSPRFNDSVKVTGKALALSGYGLSNARVAYHITRNRDDYSYSRISNNYKMPYLTEINTQIAADTVSTDSVGQYTIKFKAIPGDLDLIQKGVVYSYNIIATITEESGETRTANTQVRIGKNDINFYVNLPDVQMAQDSAKYDISLKNLNGHNQPGNLKTEIFALKQPDRVFKGRLWNKPDLYLLSQAEYSQDFDFAYAHEDDPNSWQQERVFHSTLDITGNNKNQLDLTSLSQQKSGLYKVIFSAQSANGDTASYSKLIKVRNKIEMAVLMDDWVTEVNTQVEAGQSAEFWLGTGEPMQVLMEIYQGKKIRSSQWMQVNKPQSVKIPVNNKDVNLSVQFLTVYQNRQYVRSYNIRLKNQDRELKLHMLSFRNKLIPGQQEEWKMQISNPKNEKIMAEVLAGMYDASLDQIAPKQWWNYWEDLNNNNYFNWYNYNFVREKTSSAPFKINSFWKEILKQHEHLNLFGYNYFVNNNSGYQQYLRSIENKKATALFEEQAKNGYEISGTVRDSSTYEPLIGVSILIDNKAIAGTNLNGEFKIKVPKNSVLQLTYVGYNVRKFTVSRSGIFNLTLQENVDEMHQVVVRGYTPQTRYVTTGSTRVVSGAQVLDAPVANVEHLLQGKVAGLNIAYGVRGSVNIRGTNSFVTNSPDNEPLVIRKNFKETAFFYPQLRTDENGQTLISFTIPESLTKWRFQAFAHTKELATGTLEANAITQKQLMISANMPRFFREGDTLSISARLANLSEQTLKGKIKLELFNAMNMQPVKLFAQPDKAVQSFEINSQSNQSVSFQLLIPADLDAITYRISAISDLHTDGEENTVPVLSNQMLVTESMPMMVRAGQQKTFTFEKLANQKSSTLKSRNLTLEYTQNPAWYAVQALPYLTDYPYDCSEQIFSRYYANSFAAAIVKKNPKIKQVFDQWMAADSKSLLSNLEKNAELKSILLEETPWLQQAQNESEQQKRIALLFDLNQNSYQLQQNLEKLQQRQLPNGGFPWFGGNHADRYITQHMIAGMGQLYHLKITDNTNQKLNAIRNKAITYLDNELLNPQKQIILKNIAHDDLLTIEIHAWYARSYFPEIKIADDLQTIKSAYLIKAAKQWKFRSIYEQGLIALTLWRSGNQEVTAQIIRSLNETAQQSPKMGMYWSKNQSGWFWYQSPIETQSLMIELFTEAKGEAKAIEEMKIWLMRNKQTNHWRTTKATAAATYALLMKGNDLLSTSSNTSIKINNTLLQDLKPDLKAEAGTGYIKTNWTRAEIKPALAKIDLHNTGKSVSWGALYWQYTEKLDKITSSNTAISLQRKYSIERINASGTFLQEINRQNQPKVGDILKVVVYLKADRDFDYIHLKDMRPSGTEPVDVLSNYKYQDGLYYYQVTKDVATNFFMSRLNKGSYVFEYRLRVAQSGNFATGISSIQSMYAPEFNAHSEGGRLEFGK